MPSTFVSRILPLLSTDGLGIVKGEARFLDTDSYPEIQQTDVLFLFFLLEMLYVCIMYPLCLEATSSWGWEFGSTMGYKGGFLYVFT